MIQWSIARRYARALFEALGEDFEGAKKDLEAIAAALEKTPEFEAFVTDPTVGSEDRRRVAEKLAEGVGAGPIVANLLRLLADRNRLGSIGGIAQVFSEMANERLGRVHAKVVSATKLPEATREKLQAALAEATNKKVDLDVAEDPEILGGMVAQVGSTVFDGSLRTQLESLRRDLAGRA